MILDCYVLVFCRGIRHVGAFSQSAVKPYQSLRCKPCERLYKRVIGKKLNLEWLETHLRDGSIRESHPDLFVAKHGRPVTTCMSPDANSPWSGDAHQVVEPNVFSGVANPKKRALNQINAGVLPDVNDQAGEQDGGEATQGVVLATARLRSWSDP